MIAFVGQCDTSKIWHFTWNVKQPLGNHSNANVSYKQSGTIHDTIAHIRYHQGGVPVCWQGVKSANDRFQEVSNEKCDRLHNLKSILQCRLCCDVVLLGVKSILVYYFIFILEQNNTPTYNNVEILPF